MNKNSESLVESNHHVPYQINRSKSQTHCTDIPELLNQHQLGPKRSSSGILSFFKWFKKNNDIKSFDQTDSSGSSKLSRNPSQDSLYSTATVASFTYVPPDTYKPFGDASTPEKRIAEGPETETLKKRIKNLEKVREKDKNLTLRKKYKLFSYDSKSKSLDEKTGKKKKIISDYSELSLPLIKENKNENLNKEKIQKTHKRSVSDSSKDKKAGAYCHVKGKRKAPSPPKQDTRNGEQKNTLDQNKSENVLGNINTLDSQTISPNSTLTRKSKRPAPQPPNMHRINDSPSSHLTPEQKDFLITNIIKLQNSKIPTDHTSKIFDKCENNLKNFIRQEVKTSEILSESSILKDDKIKLDNNDNEKPEEKKNLPINNNNELSNEKNDYLKLECGVLKPTKENNKILHYQKFKPPGSPIIAPRPWYKRSLSHNEKQEKPEKPKENKFSNLFSRFSINLEDKKKEDNNRKSGITILTNISELDREASIIIQKEKEMKNDEYISKKTSAKDLISKFNAYAASNDENKTYEEINFSRRYSFQTNESNKIQKDCLMKVPVTPPMKRSIFNLGNISHDYKIKENKNGNDFLSQTKPKFNQQNFEKDNSSQISTLIPSAPVLENEYWTCQRCTLENLSINFKCKACGVWKPFDKIKKTESSALTNNFLLNDTNNQTKMFVAETSFVTEKVFNKNELLENETQRARKFAENVFKVLEEENEDIYEKPDNLFAKNSNLVKAENENKLENKSIKDNSLGENEVIKNNLKNEKAEAKRVMIVENEEVLQNKTNLSEEQIRLRKMLKEMKNSLPKKRKSVERFSYIETFTENGNFPNEKESDSFKNKESIEDKKENSKNNLKTQEEEKIKWLEWPKEDKNVINNKRKSKEVVDNEIKNQILSTNQTKDLDNSFEIVNKEEKLKNNLKIENKTCENNSEFFKNLVINNKKNENRFINDLNIKPLNKLNPENTNLSDNYLKDKNSEELKENNEKLPKVESIYPTNLLNMLNDKPNESSGAIPKIRDKLENKKPIIVNEIFKNKNHKNKEQSDISNNLGSNTKTDDSKDYIDIFSNESSIEKNNFIENKIKNNVDEDEKNLLNNKETTDQKSNEEDRKDEIKTKTVTVKTQNLIYENIKVKNENVNKPIKVSSSSQTTSQILNKTNSENLYPVIEKLTLKPPLSRKNSFELIRPRDFAGIATTSPTLYSNISSTNIPLIIDEIHTKSTSSSSKQSSSSEDDLTAQLSDLEGLKDFKATLKLNKHDMNTLTINGLLKRLESAIADGQHVLASKLARDLARLKVNCSVIRQRKNEKFNYIMVDMYIEDQISHQGPIPLRVSTNMTINDLKTKIFKEFEIPCHVQRWILNKQLVNDDNLTLEDFDVNCNGFPMFLYLVASDNDGEETLKKGNSFYKQLNQNVSKINNETNNQINKSNESLKTDLKIDEDFKVIPSTSKIYETDSSSYIPKEKFDKNSWKCPVCTLINSNDRPGCEACCTEKPKSDQETKDYLKLVLDIDNTDLVPNTELFECPICFLNCQVGEGVVLRECLHTFCKECLAQMIEYSDEVEIKCPYRNENYSCDSTLQEREIKTLVSKEVFEQHLSLSVKRAENLIDNTFHCRTPDCKGWCIFEDNVNQFLCPVCKAVNCLTCQVIHKGLNCKQFQENLKRESNNNEEARRTRDFLDDMVKRGDAMLCPSCQVILMKKWGCDWLRCTMCKTEICWVTRGLRWGPKGKGDTTGGCKCGVNGVKCHPKCTYCH